METFDIVSNSLTDKIREINNLAKKHHENLDQIDMKISLSTK